MVRVLSRHIVHPSPLSFFDSDQIVSWRMFFILHRNVRRTLAPRSVYVSNQHDVRVADTTARVFIGTSHTHPPSWRRLSPLPSNPSLIVVVVGNLVWFRGVIFFMNAELILEHLLLLPVKQSILLIEKCLKHPSPCPWLCYRCLFCVNWMKYIVRINLSTNVGPFLLPWFIQRIIELSVPLP